jgi:predicted nucleic acid-binding protein
VKCISDTGFLVALVEEKDRFHRWALEIAQQVTWPVLTCEPVLAEAAFLLRSSNTILGMLRDHVVEVAFDCASQVEPLHDLGVRYSDRDPDIADLCLIRMSELYPRYSIITVDEADFRVYRRNKREAIPLICPPNC